MTGKGKQTNRENNRREKSKSTKQKTGKELNTNKSKTVLKTPTAERSPAGVRSQLKNPGQGKDGQQLGKKMSTVDSKMVSSTGPRSSLEPKTSQAKSLKSEPLKSTLVRSTIKSGGKSGGDENKSVIKSRSTSVIGKDGSKSGPEKKQSQIDSKIVKEDSNIDNEPGPKVAVKPEAEQLTSEEKTRNIRIITRLLTVSQFYIGLFTTLFGLANLGQACINNERDPFMNRNDAKLEQIFYTLTSLVTTLSGLLGFSGSKRSVKILLFFCFLLNMVNILALAFIVYAYTSRTSDLYQHEGETSIVVVTEHIGVLLFVAISTLFYIGSVKKVIEKRVDGPINKSAKERKGQASVSSKTEMSTLSKTKTSEKSVKQPKKRPSSSSQPGSSLKSKIDAKSVKVVDKRVEGLKSKLDSKVQSPKSRPSPPAQSIKSKTVLTNPQTKKALTTGQKAGK